MNKSYEDTTAKCERLTAGSTLTSRRLLYLGVEMDGKLERWMNLMAKVDQSIYGDLQSPELISKERLVERIAKETDQSQTEQHSKSTQISR
jgi:hypothetical protein